MGGILIKEFNFEREKMENCDQLVYLKEEKFRG